MNMPLVLLNRRRRGFTAFSPSTLFALAEPGIWFDPSDTSTLFADPAGTTPVTAPGQTVGLMLDKSRGLALGAELVANGDFATDSNWTLGTGWTIGGGVATSSGATGARIVSTAIPAGSFIFGKFYEIAGVVTGGSVGLLVGQSSFIDAVVTGTFKVLVRAGLLGGTENQTYFAIRDAGAAVTIDNISVRELAGNHATQATLAARPTYSIEPVGGRRNLLTWSEDFSNPAWAKQLSASATASVITLSSNASSAVFRSDVPGAVQRTFSIEARSDTPQLFNLAVFDGAVVRSPTITTTTEWTRFTFTATPARADSQWLIISTGVAATFEARNAQLELGSTATPYQRVTTQHDVTEAGVASLSYLYFDGVNDAMVTSTITPGIDKVQVFAGVRKLSDANVGVVAELSASLGANNGTLMLLAPLTGGASGDFVFRSKGTALSGAASISLAPASKVVTGLGDIGGDLATLRLDGTQVAQTTTDQGTGNYLAYPLYLGAREGSYLLFTGHLYSLITRFGPTLDAPTITSTEIWVGDKTGIDIAKFTSATIYTRSGDTILDRANSTIERRAV